MLIKKIKSLDRAAIKKISKIRTKPLDKIMVFTTHLGDGALIWVIAAVCFLLTKNYKIVSMKILLSICFTTLFGEVIIKRLVGRSRPFKTLSNEKLLIKKPKSYSFPSGHTASSFGVAVVISESFPEVFFPVFFLAFAIAFSRIYLKVHYPTDVIVGVLIGIFCGALSLLIINL